MAWNQIKELQERRAALAKSAKDVLNGAEKENRSINGEEQSKFDSIMKDCDTLDKRIADLQKVESLESIESSSNSELRERFSKSEDKGTDIENRHSKLYDKYLRTGDKSVAAELRDLAKGSEVVGPRDHYGQIVESMKSYAGVFAAGAEVIETDTGLDFAISTSDDTSNTGELVTEAGANTVDSGASIGTKTLGAYKFGSKIFKVSEELLRDAGFDVAAYIARIAGERLGRVFNTYSTTGTGSSQPQGCQIAAAFGLGSGSNTDFDYDDVVDFFHSIDASYRNAPSFAFMFSDTVCAKMRKMTTGTGGTYIWQPGIAGEPDSILGKRYVINNDLPAYSALSYGSKFMLAGDWSRFKVRLVRGIEIKRLDELYAVNGQVGFVAWMRADSRLADANAIKYMRTTTHTST